MDRMGKNSALNIAHKIELWSYIKRFGQAWEETEENIAEYGKDVYNEYKNDLQPAIVCFKDLAEQGERFRKHRKIA